MDNQKDGDESQGSDKQSIESLNCYSDDSSDIEIENDGGAGNKSERVTIKIDRKETNGTAAGSMGLGNAAKIESVKSQPIFSLKDKSDQIMDKLKGQILQDHQNIVEQRQQLKNVIDMKRQKIQKKLNERTIPFIARFLLSPIQLYEIYGIFPWSLMFHVMLILILSYLCILMNNSLHTYAREQQSAFYKVFLDDGFDANDYFLDRLNTLYDSNDMVEVLDRSMNFYFQQETREARKSGMANDYIDDLNLYLCLAVDGFQGARGSNFRIRIDEENTLTDELDDYDYAEYSAYGIRCPPQSGTIYKSPVVVQIKLRGDDAAEMVNQTDFLLPEIRMVSKIIDGSFINIALRNNETYQKFRDQDQLARLINYTDTMSVLYAVNTHINMQDNPIYTDFIWIISQQFSFTERARVDLRVFFKFFPVLSSVISLQLLPQRIMSAVMFILSIVLMVLEVRSIMTINQVFKQIWKRYGEGQVLKRKFKNEFNKTLKEIFQKNMKLSTDGNQRETVVSNNQSLRFNSSVKKLKDDGRRSRIKTSPKRFVERKLGDVMNEVDFKVETQSQSQRRLSQIQMNLSRRTSLLDAHAQSQLMSSQQNNNDKSKVQSGRSLAALKKYSVGNQKYKDEMVNLMRFSNKQEAINQSARQSINGAESVNQGSGRRVHELQRQSLMTKDQFEIDVQSNQSNFTREQYNQFLKKNIAKLKKDGKYFESQDQIEGVDMEEERSELEDLSEHDKLKQQKELEIMKAKDKLHNKWSFIIIISCIINIEIGLQLLSQKEIDSKVMVIQLGFSTLLMWWSLNKYLRFTKDYSYLPKTFIESSNSVFLGLMGVMPLIIGICTFSSIMMYTNFRFKDTYTTTFTFFYMINGDTFFDSGCNSDEANGLFSIFWYFVWVNFFGMFIIINVTLAQVEEGYLESKHQNEFKFITKKIEDPLIEQQSRHEHIMQTSITIPEAMKRLNMHLKTQTAQREQNIQKQIKDVRTNQYNASIELKTLANMIEIEEYSKMQIRIKSKRNLLNMLSLQEIQWAQSQKEKEERQLYRAESGSAYHKNGNILQVMRSSDQRVISMLITQLLDHRIYFYTNMCQVLLNKFKLLNQIELPDTMTYDFVQLDELSAEGRNRQSYAITSLKDKSDRISSAVRKHEQKDQGSDSSVEFELVDDKDKMTQIQKINEEIERQSTVKQQVARVQKQTKKEFEKSKKKVSKMIKKVNPVQTSIVEALSEYNNKLNDFLGELLTDEYSANM